MKKNGMNKSLKQRLYVVLMGLASLILFLVYLLAFTSCERADEDKLFKIYEDKMIDEIMLEHSLDDFLTIVEIAQFKGTIHAYGNYTLFAPTDEAVQTYLQSIGKSTVFDLTKAEATDIVKYHLILDTIKTADFTDGRLPAPNFANTYLTNKAEADGATIYYRINRQANLLTSNLRGANGYLHILDAVLTPPTRSITQVIRTLPDEDYSFLKTVFEASGWADSLDKVNPVGNYTFFIQNNEAFKKAGIENQEQLMTLLIKNSPNVVEDSLMFQYIGYHALGSLRYTIDLMRASSIETMIKAQVILFKREANRVLLNEFKVDKINEDGVPLLLESEYTNLSCSNGVIHEIDGNIAIKNRQAYRVYWDIAEQPEIMALKVFRSGGSASFKPGDLSELNWGGPWAQSLTYKSNGALPKSLGNEQFVYNDFLDIRISTKLNSWMELKTPVLVAGKYKIWLSFRRYTKGSTIRTVFKQDGYDDQVLPYIFSLSSYSPNPSSVSHEQMLIDGWKQYNVKYVSTMCCHALGIIEVQTTGRHIVRIEATNDGVAAPLDMIQFIPVDEDQLWPRIDMAGKWIYEDTPDCEIWPTYPCVTDTTGMDL